MLASFTVSVRLLLNSFKFLNSCKILNSCKLKLLNSCKLLNLSKLIIEIVKTFWFKINYIVNLDNF